jgi:hypothetical protein
MGEPAVFQIVTHAEKFVARSLAAVEAVAEILRS